MKCALLSSVSVSDQVYRILYNHLRSFLLSAAQTEHNDASLSDAFKDLDPADVEDVELRA